MKYLILIAAILIPASALGNGHITSCVCTDVCCDQTAEYWTGAGPVTERLQSYFLIDTGE